MQQTNANIVALAVNPATNKIYLANFGEGTVSVIDEATQAVTRVPVGTHPRQWR